MNKKAIALLLALCCLAAVFSSCNNADAPSTDQDPTASSAASDTSKTEQSQSSEGDEQMNVVYQTITNPVAPSGADPWVILHEGQYYYCFSSGNGVAVSSFASLDKISTEKATVVYTAPENTAHSSNYWAPELHYINGEWYIYVAADNGDNANHRMYVLKGTTQNPMDPFEMVGKITDPTNKWAIDGTVMQWGDQMYFVWSGWEGNENVAQNIYIAHMSDPCTIDSDRVLLSKPTYAWERQGMPYVNEGPVALKNDDKLFLIFSASGSWTDNYCLGMLTLTGTDPMNPEHWEKGDQPVFKQRRFVAYGPGHCSFAPACDGSIWMIYHANLVSGSSWAGRSVWLAPVTFKEDGAPKFGHPSFQVEFPTKGNNE